MVSVLVSSAVNRCFKLQSGQAKEYDISIVCFSAKHAPLISKIKYSRLGIRIMRRSRTTYLHPDCYFSELAL